MNRMQKSQPRGVALVLVLAFLALISVFIIGFFSSATGELTSSTSYAASITTRHLADSATSLVMAQIREATTRISPQAADPTKHMDAWASQPGMIRTFKGGPLAHSTTTALYKLYSSDLMTLESTEAVSFKSKDDVPVGTNGWTTQPSLFTDLNEPVTIVDPVNSTGTVDRYPIIDPGAFQVVDSAAFNSNVSPATQGKVPGAMILSDSSLLPEKQARMPVRWLYVLRDGSISAPKTQASDAGRTANFDTQGVYPTPENPIVGRIAFWTDDDTCKVNINTAGGYSENDPSVVPNNQAASYWGIPRLSSSFDRGHVDRVTGKVTTARNAEIEPMAAARPGDGLSLAISQPGSGEFQRYPGHPSTTSLGLVLGSFGLLTNQVYHLAPRLVPSNWNPNSGKAAGSNNGRVPSHPDLDAPLPAKFDRIYANVDEMLFADYTSPADLQLYEYPSPLPSQYVRKLGSVRAQTGKKTQLAPADLDKLRFFLTAHSRAPELNLFGRPRVSLWPMWPVFGQPGASASYPKRLYVDKSNNQGYASTKSYTVEDFRRLMNPSDKLLAFCSTIGAGFNDQYGRPYMFQRYDAYDPRNDSLIPRNRALFTMLSELTSTPVPGFGTGRGGQTGGAFSDPQKYGRDHTQIVAEIFDYIRTINLRDSTNDVAPSYVQTPPPSPNGFRRNTFKYAPKGIVVPSVINQPADGFNDTPAFGRFPLISEVAIDFYHAGYFGRSKKMPPPKGKEFQNQLFFRDRTEIGAYPSTRDLEPNYLVLGRMISCFLIIETFNPMQGYSAISNFDPSTEVKNQGMMILHEIKGLDQFAMTAPSMAGEVVSFNMPKEATNAYWLSSGSTWGGRQSGGYEGFFHTLAKGTAINPIGAKPPQDAFRQSGDTAVWYPFQATPPSKGFKIAQSVIAGDPSGGPKDSTPMEGISRYNPATGEFFTIGSPWGILVRDSDRTFDFKGGKLTVSIKWGPRDQVAINSFDLVFPDGRFPMPEDNYWDVGYEKNRPPPSGPPDQKDEQDPGGFAARYLPLKKGLPGRGMGAWNATLIDEDYQNTQLPPADPKDPNVVPPPAFRGLQYSFDRRVAWVSGAAIQGDYPGSLPGALTAPGKPYDGAFYRNRWRQIIQPGDTIRSLVPAIWEFSQNNGRESGDLRVLALLGPDDVNKEKYFSPHPYYHNVAGSTLIMRHAHNLRSASGTYYINDFIDPTAPSNPPPALSTERERDEFLAPASNDPRTALYPNRNSPQAWRASFGELVAVYNTPYRYTTTTAADLPATIRGVKRSDGFEADFDSGTGSINDGPYTGKADEGAFTWKWWDSIALAYRYSVPYFDEDHGTDESNQAYFSPNRQIASAVSFGSLLSGRKKHWTTLAFSPNPAGAAHPGLAKDPKDHTLLDLFTMPVVEPYAISEPFSTAGKININYPIVPFDFIKRTTGLRAALQPMRVMALDTNQVANYKRDTKDAVPYNPRYLLNVEKTLILFDEFFKPPAGERIFRSASQICEQFLVPKDAAVNITSVKGMEAYWRTKQLTPDNEREKPYADLYPRITTKSNTYTVYMRVQTLKKRGLVGGTASSRSAFHLQWNEGQDQVLSEYRGYTTIERYLDPQDYRITGQNPEINPDKQSLEPAYRFRIIETKRFQP
jgi:uncharacterized protein (TIGR02600 family)